MTNVIDHDDSDASGDVRPDGGPAPAGSPLRIVRGRDGWIGGVCSGLSVTAGVDVALVRLAFVLAALPGLGAVIYAVLWILAPRAGDNGTPEPRPATPTQATTIKWILLLGACGVFSVAWYIIFDDEGIGGLDPFPFDDLGSLVGVGLIALGVAWFVRRDREGGSSEQTSPLPPPAAPSTAQPSRAEPAAWAFEPPAVPSAPLDDGTAALPHPPGVAIESDANGDVSADADVQPTQPADVAAPSDSTEPTEPTEGIEPIEPIDPIDPIEAMEPTEPIEDVGVIGVGHTDGGGIDATRGMSPPPKQGDRGGGDGPGASSPSPDAVSPDAASDAGEGFRWRSLAVAVLAWLGILTVLAVHFVIGVVVSIDVISLPGAMALNIVAIAAVVAMIVAASLRRHAWLYGAGVLVLLATGGIAASVGSFNGETGRTVFAVTDSGELEPEYRNAIGHLTVDLSAVDFEGPDSLRALRFEGGIGRLDVIVPDDVDLDVDYHVQGGDFVFDGRSVAGWDIQGSRSLDGTPAGRSSGPDALPGPTTTTPNTAERASSVELQLDVDMAFGQTLVCQAADVSPGADQCPPAR